MVVHSPLSKREASDRTESERQVSMAIQLVWDGAITRVGVIQHSIGRTFEIELVMLEFEAVTGKQLISNWYCYLKMQPDNLRLMKPSCLTGAGSVAGSRIRWRQLPVLVDERVKAQFGVGFGRIDLLM